LHMEMYAGYGVRNLNAFVGKLLFNDI
jgi:hypothetical protein